MKVEGFDPCGPLLALPWGLWDQEADLLQIELNRLPAH
jgi:hypothetical protein